MTRTTNSGRAAVVRDYRHDADACERAVKLLLEHKEKAAGQVGGKDDAEGDPDDRAKPEYTR